MQGTDNEVIDLDDEEEIDDVEKEDKTNKQVIDLETPKKLAATAESSSSAAEDSAAGATKRSLEEGETSESKKAKGDE